MTKKLAISFLVNFFFNFFKKTFGQMTEIRDQKIQCWGGAFSDDDDDDDDAWSVRLLRRCKNVSGHWSRRSSEDGQSTTTPQSRENPRNKKNAHTRTPTHTHNLRRKYRNVFLQIWVEVMSDDDPSREGRSVGRSVLTNVKSINKKKASKKVWAGAAMASSSLAT